MAIYVTKPDMPPLDLFTEKLKVIWDSGQITNAGPVHQELEERLSSYLGVPYISLFSNATLALIVALKALDLKGEVITTPYTFVATPNALLWAGLEPVFVDIDPNTFNLDPTQVQRAITERTSGILPVHVYGTPCDDNQIKQVAQTHGLKVLYDAAHAFGVRRHGRSILLDGDLSVVSFHATKVFNTAEGGAVICQTRDLKQRVDRLKNFGYISECHVEEAGINAKMSEISAALGLLQLDRVEQCIAARSLISQCYHKHLRVSDRMSIHEPLGDFSRNHSYFPILVGGPNGALRDSLYEFLKAQGIFARRYFYPLVTEFGPYRYLAERLSTPVADSISKRVLCLPIYPSLAENEARKISELVNQFIAGEIKGFVNTRSKSL